MTTMHPPEHLSALFSGYKRTAFRLEVRTSYGMDDAERAAYERFLRGDDPGIQWHQPWLDLVASKSSSRMERVRVIDQEPSPYLRFELAMTPQNLAAGDVIHYLPRAAAAELRLPDSDFWLFDSAIVAILRFDAEDTFIGINVHTNPMTVLKHVQWAETALLRAMTFDQYCARVPGVIR